MDYQQIMITLLSSIVTIIVIPLITFAGKAIVNYLNQKINDKETTEKLVAISQIIFTTVENIAREYVNSLKTNNKLDKESHFEILQKIKNIIMQELNQDLKAFIQKEYGTLDEWIDIQIETILRSFNLL